MNTDKYNIRGRDRSGKVIEIKMVNLDLERAIRECLLLNIANRNIFWEPYKMVIEET